MDLDTSVVGGFLCGALAGGGARYGRLCSMSAIEDALVGHDYRGAKAWGLAVAVAGLATMGMVAAGIVSLETSSLLAPRVHLLGLILGGVIFGLGMALVGTCSFGLIVRAGAGDLRALVSALFVGIFAFSSTAGLLAPARHALLPVGYVDLSAFGQSSVDRLLAPAIGAPTARLVAVAVFLSFAALALRDARLRGRPRLLAAAVALGLGVAGGWLVTSIAIADLAVTRVESLSFVAPVGRALLQFMTMPFREVSFGMAAVLGTLVASFGVAAIRRELRWEAFDDAREMRRHLLGGALMGLGGVLGHGCTVGQGLSAASALAVSAPVFVAAVLIGARLGLRILIEGTALWRLGFSPRAE